MSSRLTLIWLKTVRLTDRRVHVFQSLLLHVTYICIQAYSNFHISRHVTAAEMEVD
jgi:hypothetical protein